MNAVFRIETVKVAGAPAENIWSGNFSEKPTDAAKLEFRGQLFLVITLKSATNSAEATHKFWQDFLEKFYSDLSGSVLTAIGESANFARSNLASSVALDSLDFVAASIWGKILYLAQAGAATAALVRKNKFSQVLAENTDPTTITTASGFLEDSDLVFLATASFFQSFPSLEKYTIKSLTEIEEELAVKIGESTSSEKIAVQVIKISEERIPQEEEVVKFAEPGAEKSAILKSRVTAGLDRLPKQLNIRFWFNFLLNIVQSAFRFLAGFFPRKEIYLKLGVREFIKQKLFTLLLLILILILSISLGAGIWQRQRKQSLEKFEGYLSRALTLYEEAQGVSTLNRLRARELLDEAQKNLEEAKKLKFDKVKVAALGEKINQANLQSLKLVKVENPAIVFDLNLVKSQVQLAEIEKVENIFAFDRQNPTLFLVDLMGKTGQIVAGGSQFTNFSNFTATGNFAFFLKAEDGIYQLDLTTKEIKKVVEKDANWGQILDLASFSSNLYLLDSKNSQIWKYTKIPEGFAQIRPFLSNKPERLDFSNSSFAIDGFIWVLAAGGKLYQTSPAEVQSIEISGLDKPLSTKTIVRTNSEAENLYIADLGNSRILVLSKAGLYLAQYSNGLFANLSDFLVDEITGKIYFAKESKIFQFDLVK